MFSENNTYRMDVGEGDLRAWNLEEIYGQLNWLFSRSRNKVNGNPLYKTRSFPGHIKTRAAGKWQKAFSHQDSVKSVYREIEASGNMAYLCVLAPFGKVRLNHDLAEFFMHNSEIANLHTVGWIIVAE